MEGETIVCFQMKRNNSMKTKDVTAIPDILTTLPLRAKQRLVNEAWQYREALDKAINTVLSPTIGRSGKQFIVEDEVIPLYGVGATPQEALEDYCSVVVEYYESLEEDENELGPSLRAQLEVLRRVFAFVNDTQVN